ncbi:MAG: hypothetical protein FJY43_12670 [Betaproteobacteria bacterium]|nr:hypothetical protein [Betaproteobacteria bacterium]
MFEFMILQVIAITAIVVFPRIAIELPSVLQAEARAVKTEQVDDSMNRLEEDPATQMQDKAEEEEGEEKEKGGDPLEKDEMKAKK